MFSQQSIGPNLNNKINFVNILAVILIKRLLLSPSSGIIWEIVTRYLTATSFSLSLTLLHLYFCVSLIMKEKYFYLSKMLSEQN